MKKNIRYIFASMLILTGFLSCDMEELPQATASRVAIF